jgi:cytoskeletal protein CcmA (bactofilin family)
MFKKKGDDGLMSMEPVEPVIKTPVKAADPDVRKRNVSVIGPTLKFRGELSANEDLVIEGQIEGSIAHQDKNLTIGRQGRVNADIHASVVEILGEVEGDVRGDELVKLHKTAVVRGNIFAQRLVMEDGANFTGSIDMTRTSAPRATASATKQDALKRANLSVADSGSHINTGGS